MHAPSFNRKMCLRNLGGTCPTEATAVRRAAVPMSRRSRTRCPIFCLSCSPAPRGHVLLTFSTFFWWFFRPPLTAHALFYPFPWRLPSLSFLSLSFLPFPIPLLFTCGVFAIFVIVSRPFFPLALSGFSSLFPFSAFLSFSVPGRQGKENAQ